MDVVRDMPGLAEEMLAVEAETFEVEDYTDPAQLMDGACSCTSSTTSTSSSSTS